MRPQRLFEDARGYPGLLWVWDCKWLFVYAKGPTNNSEQPQATLRQPNSNLKLNSRQPEATRGNPDCVPDLYLENILVLDVDWSSLSGWI